MLCDIANSFEIAEYYANKFDEILVHPVIFAEFSIIILAAFIIRFFVLYNIEKNQRSREDMKYVVPFIISHTLLELLAAFIIGYVIIKQTNANLESYIINMIIAPASGLILAVYIDNKFLMPIESDSPIGKIINKHNIKLSNSESKKSNQEAIQITINNNASEGAPELTCHTAERSFDHLSEDDIPDDSFKEVVVNAINTLKDVEFSQEQDIKKQERQLEEVLEIVNTMKHTLMIDKKIELKQMIYRCLNKGYATPEENDKITLFYTSYTSLGGNHEVESLYKDHYIQLQVRDVPASNASMYTVSGNMYEKCSYGMYDNRN